MAFSLAYGPHDIDRLIDEAFNERSFHFSPGHIRIQRNTPEAGKPYKPKINLHENAETNTVTLQFEVPGLKKEDIDLSVHNNRLTVTGETKAPEGITEEGYIIRERKYGKFFRTIQLPTGVKDTDIKASAENGLLTVTFPKTSPERAAKSISIQ